MEGMIPGGMSVLCGLDPVVSGLSGPGPEAVSEALTLAREVSHPFSLAFALNFAATGPSYSARRDQAAQERAEEAACRLPPSRGFRIWYG